MPASLQKFRYHAAEDPTVPAGEPARSAESFREPVPGGLESAVPPISFSSDEAAARFYMEELLQRDDRPELRESAELASPDRVPGLRVEGVTDLRALDAHQVRFAQTYADIPIFGAGAVVELTTARELVSVNAQLDQVAGVDPLETLSRADALARVAQYTGVALPAEAGLSGRLNFYKDDADTWHLAWLLTGVPAEPPTGDTEPDPDAEAGHGLGPRPLPARYDYLVDAHDGEILFQYSAAPTAAPTVAAAPLPIPASCTGTDEDDRAQAFFGTLVNSAGTECELNDPLRLARTYEMNGADLDSDPPLPATPIRASTSDFSTTNRGGISAHVNACRVLEFYQSVLQRDSIDDKGMAIISRVNVTWARQEPPPTLLNAFWWNGNMWYGQIRRNGRLVSLSRYLDVIGHELTHGVIETTSNLVYATQSGALNESFADCAGVIINNWFTASDRNDVDTWDWEIGRDLRASGKPLRDFADPTRVGLPAHMNQFRRLAPGQTPNGSNDNGFVHFNSNIHNKAVHNLLTLKLNGTRVLTVTEVAVLTYLGMARLTRLATFSDARQSMLDVAQTMFGGNPNKQDKLDTIRKAYDLVGIV
jgi:Zn-dependent metalloprotease